MSDSLFDSLPVALIQLNAGGGPVRINPAAARLLRLPVSAPGSQALAGVSFTAPDGTPCSLHDVANSLLGDEAGSAGSVVACADGFSLSLDVTGARMDGAESGEVILALQDASQRQRAEVARRQGEERMNRTQEIAHLGTWELDLVENRLSWSDEVYRLFGLRPQEFGATYEAFLDAVHPDDRAAVDEAYSGSLREGRDCYDIEHRVVRRSDGAVRIVHERCEHVRDDSGRIVRSFGMVQDVTDNRVSEEALREQTARLAQADRIKDEFLATLSHELRTPLSTILVWAHLLVHTELDEASRRRAQEVILSSASAQKEIIDEVLDVSRIISGKMALNVGEVALEVVLGAALEVVRPAASAKRLRLEVHAEPNLLVLGDAARLQQVLWNLLANAVKFSDEGGAVHVDSSRDGSSVRVVVADTGIGILPEFLPHVFDRFAQQDASPGRQYGGLGLGLAIARHLIELHGGTIEAESPGSGQGATFTVLLPARTRRARRAEAGEGAGPGADPPVQRLLGTRVLVVDDEADAREVTGTVLQKAGATVALASSTAEALECLQADGHDVLVADIGMPGTDGHALIAAVRRLEGPVARIPAIALSAYTRDTDRRQALAAGFDRHLAKPATPAELVDAVVRLPRFSPSGQP
jgi:PAS domain S-box-containing protein